MASWRVVVLMPRFGFPVLQRLAALSTRLCLLVPRQAEHNDNDVAFPASFTYAADEFVTVTVLHGQILGTDRIVHDVKPALDQVLSQIPCHRPDVKFGIRQGPRSLGRVRRTCLKHSDGI